MKTFVLLAICGAAFAKLNVNAGRKLLEVDNVACLGEPDRGPCRASVRRYYYDNETSTCKEFTYGGCEGNRNNYETFEECRASCNPATEYEAKCLARPELGPCRSRWVAWAYNASLGQCKSFMYGGCDGNENNYGTKEKCEAACKHPSAELVEGYATVSQQLSALKTPLNPVCSLPRERGPCLAYIPRFYYNNETEHCDQFIYGGCQGNANNFNTLTECSMTCNSGVNVGITNFETEPEVGYENFTERLLKMQAPLEDRVCNLPMDKGPCSGIFPRYYYKRSTNTCEEFEYGGCGGNANNFKTVNECESKCGTLEDRVCNLPMDKGPCSGIFPRYYYKRSTTSCEEFEYGGCGGNANNFKTINECESKCGNLSLTDELVRSRLITKLVALEDVIRANPILSREVVGLNPVCNETKYPGPCFGYFPRYYYNNVTKTCERFIYGGCRANGNNFQTLEECQNTCWTSLDQHSLKIVGAVEVPHWPFTPPEVCTFPADAGPCKAYMPRFFYNTLSETCEQFVYGGCRGNGNNFPTYDACQKRCKTVFGVVPRA